MEFLYLEVSVVRNVMSLNVTSTVYITFTAVLWI